MKRYSGFLLVFIFFLIASAAYSADQSRLDPDELLSKMSLKEKIGQMILVDKMYLEKDSDINEYSMGGLLCGGDSYPEDLTAKGWADMADRYQNIAVNSKLKIPLLFGIDAVHGQAKVVDATIFPHNIGMGCTADPALVRKMAIVTASEMKATGFYWDFAPCVAVARDERWGRTYESYSEDPKLVTVLAAAYVKGLEGSGVISSAKHFIGDGGTLNGKNEGDAFGDEALLRTMYLPPYLAALSNGTRIVMPSFSRWNNIPMHKNRDLITGLLKGELQFSGMVVSDWGAVNKLPNLNGSYPGNYSEQLIQGIDAGIDMLMLPRDYKKFMETMITLVDQGRIKIDRINDAVRRILKVKIDSGLFNRYLADRALLKSVGSQANRTIARQSVRESAVLLKNKNSFLPLSKNIRKILVAGMSADNMDNQCGGWTVYWAGNSGRVVNGTTVLQAIKKAVSPKTRVIYYEGEDEPVEKADAAVFVTGEYPYAESGGDSPDLAINPGEMETLQKIIDKGIPVVVVLISGRPLIITKELPKWNALIAAWLPGSEGDGIADLLFGDYNPTGKLSMSWPADMSQVPVNVGDKNYQPLFSYGFGLRYK